MNIGPRLKKVRQDAKLTQKELAQLSGVAQQIISGLETGKYSETKDIVKLARALGVSPSWLSEGRPDYSSIVNESNNLSNITPVEIVCRVPLISWSEVVEWCENPQLHKSGNKEESIPVTKKIGINSYALEVEGVGMLNPSGEGYSFTPGSIIVCDPDQKPRNESFVIAKLPGSEDVVFKQLIIEGGRKYLASLNPKYPTIPMDETVIIYGVLRQILIDVE